MATSILSVAGVSFVILFLLMCVVWLWFRRIDNAAVVDVGWGNGFAIAAIVSCLLSTGWADRRWLVAALVVFWGERLTLHLLFDRILGGKPEDGRYQHMRRRWKTNLPLKFFLFFQFQTVLVIVLSLPFFLSMQNPEPSFHWLELVGVALWVIGLAGESIADAQLRRFRSRPENRARTCRSGLWRFSRHPNYFFEWIVWLGYGVIGLASPWGWLGLLSPVGMWYILTRVTGIPLTEEQALRNRGEEYRRYQQTTNAFVPWFPKPEPVST
jgi:steroid 5-alpha reductase family enzyme